VDRGDPEQERQARERKRHERKWTLRPECLARVGQNKGHRLVVDTLQGLEQLSRIVPIEPQRARLEAVHQEAQQDYG
jgi:hypothetical protein